MSRTATKTRAGSMAARKMHALIEEYRDTFGEEPIFSDRTPTAAKIRTIETALDSGEQIIPPADALDWDAEEYE